MSSSFTRPPAGTSPESRTLASWRRHPLWRPGPEPHNGGIGTLREQLAYALGVEAPAVEEPAVVVSIRITIPSLEVICG